MCPESLFAFYMGGANKDRGAAGELTICGTDPAHYKVLSNFYPSYPNIRNRIYSKGAIAWVPLIAERLWRIELGPVYARGTSLTTSAQQAIVDTGSSIITAPMSVVQQVIPSDAEMGFCLESFFYSILRLLISPEQKQVHKAHTKLNATPPQVYQHLSSPLVVKNSFLKGPITLSRYSANVDVLSNER